AGKAPAILGKVIFISIGYGGGRTTSSSRHQPRLFRRHGADIGLDGLQLELARHPQQAIDHHRADGEGGERPALLGLVAEISSLVHRPALKLKAMLPARRSGKW